MDSMEHKDNLEKGSIKKSQEKEPKIEEIEEKEEDDEDSMDKNISFSEESSSCERGIFLKTLSYMF